MTRLLIALLLLTSCIQHRISTTVPAGHAGIDSRLSNHPMQQSALERRSVIPLESHISQWQLDGPGQISRQERILQTPLPWWQRFPIDFLVDCYPGTVILEAEERVLSRGLTANSSPEQLDQRADALRQRIWPEGLEFP